MMDLDLKKLQQIDPVKAHASASAQDMGQGLSPMSPPDPYAPPADNPVDYNSLHPFLKNLMDEHEDIKGALQGFKQLLSELAAKRNLENPLHNKLKDFIDYFFAEFIPHNLKEESQLFPLLNKRLLERGEHSPTKEKFTGIKILKDDHYHAIRIGSSISSQLEIALLLEDQKSKIIVLQQFLKQSNELTELLELHIFREDQIIFGLAQELLTESELNEIHEEFNIQ